MPFLSKKKYEKIELEQEKIEQKVLNKQIENKALQDNLNRKLDKQQNISKFLVVTIFLGM